MKIILPGGTGHLGRLLVRALTREGHACVILARDADYANRHLTADGLAGAARAIAWDGRTPGPWVAELDGADAVINLAGRSVDCRYTERNLATMLHSRVETTRAIGEAIATAKNPPRVWLNASTATIYAHALPNDPPRDEAAGEIGGHEPDVPALWKRSVDIALAWERELFTAATPHTRRVALRAAMVMASGRGGAFNAFAGLCTLGMGQQGNGRQFVSWIHEYDFVAAVRFLLVRDDLDGTVNLAAPTPLPNRDFIAAIHSALGRHFAVPAPAWLLEIGAFFRRTETELLLKSRRVVPARLIAAGFRFRFPIWPEAAAELIARRANGS
jgi:uncharacterized protein (TIGR01777 family)